MNQDAYKDSTSPLQQDNRMHRRAAILEAAIKVFGKQGFRKTSIDDLAKAASISRQGLYLYFSGKDEVLKHAIKKYLDDGIELVKQELADTRDPLIIRLTRVMDAWFGRHWATFDTESFDLIDAGNRLFGGDIDDYKSAFKRLVAEAIFKSSDGNNGNATVSNEEAAEVLFICGLTWKEPHPSRQSFVNSMTLCIKAVCNL